MNQTLRLSDLVAYLDTFLRPGAYPDHPAALNGLQVQNRGIITGIVAAVDACQASIDHAAGAGDEVGASPLLLVHHGLFWDGNLPVTRRRYLRLRALLESNVALYASHIPLDVHPEVGNNAVLARELGVEHTEPFGAYQGIQLGVMGTLVVERATLIHRLEEHLGTTVRLLPGGPELVQRVALITGAAAGHVREAADAGCDTFITGEGNHHTYFDATEFGLNVLLAGHYATETAGVRALAAHLADRFDLPWVFHHHPTGL